MHSTNSYIHIAAVYPQTDQMFNIEHIIADSEKFPTIQEKAFSKDILNTQDGGNDDVIHRPKGRHTKVSVTTDTPPITETAAEYNLQTDFILVNKDNILANALSTTSVTLHLNVPYTLR